MPGPARGGAPARCVVLHDCVASVWQGPRVNGPCWLVSRLRVTECDQTLARETDSMTVPGPGFLSVVTQIQYATIDSFLLGVRRGMAHSAVIGGAIGAFSAGPPLTR